MFIWKALYSIKKLSNVFCILSNQSHNETNSVEIVSCLWRHLFEDITVLYDITCV